MHGDSILCLSYSFHSYINVQEKIIAFNKRTELVSIFGDENKTSATGVFT